MPTTCLLAVLVEENLVHKLSSNLRLIKCYLYILENHQNMFHRLEIFHHWLLELGGFHFSPTCQSLSWCKVPSTGIAGPFVCSVRAFTRAICPKFLTLSKGTIAFAPLRTTMDVEKKPEMEWSKMTRHKSYTTTHHPPSTSTLHIIRIQKE